MTGLLVVAAHPDDAELAVGGTLARMADAGVRTTVAVVAVSERDPHRRHLRTVAAEHAAKVLGYELRWLADDLDQVEDLPEYDLVRRVDALVDEVVPAAVLTHWDGDSHGDHVRVARAVVSSSRRWPGVTLAQFAPNEHRTARWHEFVPNVFVTIGEQLDRKVEALAAYSYPGQGFRALDLDWVRHLAVTYGHVAGEPAAEALRLLRHRAGAGSALFVEPPPR